MIFFFPGIYVEFGAMRSPINSAINLFLAALISYPQSERLSFSPFLPTDDFQLIILLVINIWFSCGAEIPVTVTVPNTLHQLKYTAEQKTRNLKMLKIEFPAVLQIFKKKYFKKKMELLFQPWLSHGCACWSSPCLWACFAVCIPPFLSAAPPVLFTPHYCALPAFPVADCLARAGFCLFFCY